MFSVGKSFSFKDSILLVFLGRFQNDYFFAFLLGLGVVTAMEGHPNSSTSVPMQSTEPSHRPEMAKQVPSPHGDKPEGQAVDEELPPPRPRVVTNIGGNVGGGSGAKVKIEGTELCRKRAYKK